MEPQIFQLAKNLTRKEAYKIVKLKAKKDFRGFNYNPDTGIARLI